MNTALFDEMAGHVPLCQNHAEWRAFLQFASAWFADRGIANPLVVELGVERGGQKTYYERLLNATHIGIDIGDNYCQPDIKGDIFDSRTMALLNERLAGRWVDLLFIDIDSRQASEKAYRMYESRVSGLIAIHSIDVIGSMTWQFWNALKGQADGMTKVEFVARHPIDHPWHITPMGIGVVINA